MVRAFFTSGLVVVTAAINVWAVGKGRSLDYAGRGMAPVVFDGTAHSQFRCSDCHATLFPMKKKTVLTHQKMDAGRYCGACHDGKTAFSTQSKCEECHKDRDPAQGKAAPTPRLK